MLLSVVWLSLCDFREYKFCHREYPWALSAIHFSGLGESELCGAVFVDGPLLEPPGITLMLKNHHVCLCARCLTLHLWLLPQATLKSRVVCGHSCRWLLPLLSVSQVVECWIRSQYRVQGWKGGFSGCFQSIPAAPPLFCPYCPPTRLAFLSYRASWEYDL